VQKALKEIEARGEGSRAEAVRCQAKLSQVSLNGRLQWCSYKKLMLVLVLVLASISMLIYSHSYLVALSVSAAADGLVSGVDCGQH
jgi:hypothetical protein